MILIADSGSTKTDWRWVDENRTIHQYATKGINPNHLSKEDIQKIISEELIAPAKEKIMPKNIYFYGAGCGSEAKNKLVKEVLSVFFSQAKILVDNDLLGAAKATCGDEKGIVAILGTGSNTCYYDGLGIVQRIGGWGYILGDEGSGAHLGKNLLMAFLNDEIPESIREKFEQQFHLSKEDIVDQVYKSHLPNRFFASFSKFMGENIADVFIENIVKRCFEIFFEKHICKYQTYQTANINFVGSVAYHFSVLLKETAKNKNFQINTIIKAPIDGLLDYHLKQL